MGQKYENFFNIKRREDWEDRRNGLGASGFANWLTKREGVIFSPPPPEGERIRVNE